MLYHSDLMYKITKQLMCSILSIDSHAMIDCTLSNLMDVLAKVTCSSESDLTFSFYLLCTLRVQPNAMLVLPPKQC